MGTLSAGEEDEAGVLGNDSTTIVMRNFSKSTSSLAPVPVAGGLTFGSINAGSATTCGTTTNGNAYCWGSSDFGNLLGQGEDDTCRSKARSRTCGQVSFDFKPNSISVGLDHVCAIKYGG